MRNKHLRFLLLNDRGQALATTAVLLTVLLGFAGLAIDMGMLRHERRLQQTAADAAAIAGATNLSYGDSGGVVAIQTGGVQASAGNGFTDQAGAVSTGTSIDQCTNTASIGTVCVQVSSPPTKGPHAGDNKYVEAYVAAVQPTYFIKIFGTSSSPLDRAVVTARAVATGYNSNTNQGGCLYTLGPPCLDPKGHCQSDIDGININGNATLNAPTCGINDNGDYNPSGNSLTINAATFGVAGQDLGGTGGTVTCAYQTNCPAYNAPAVQDPLSLSPPTAPVAGPDGITNQATGGCTLSNGSVSCAGNGTVWPGTYHTIDLGGGAGTITLEPGVYILDDSNNPPDNHGFYSAGNSTINGNGVMFYFKNDATVNLQGTDTVNLTAPTATTCPACCPGGAGSPTCYYGILMYQDPTDTNQAPGATRPQNKGPQLGGNSGSVFQGTLYFPTAELTFYGHDNTSANCTQGPGGVGQTVGVVVTAALSLSGTPDVCLKGTAGLPNNTTILRNAILVE